MSEVFVLMDDSYEGGSLLGCASTLEEAQQLGARAFAQALDYQTRLAYRRGGEPEADSPTELVWTDDVHKFRGKVLGAQLPSGVAWLSIYRVTLGEYLDAEAEAMWAAYTPEEGE
jgi:hypothetical protein